MGQGYETLYRSVVSYAKRNQVYIGVNPGTIQIEQRKKYLFDLMKVTYVLFVNLEEAQAVSGESSVEPHRLVTALWKMGPKKVVVTDGKNGSYAFDGKEVLHCPIFPGRLVEATGAGDAFATGFIGALMHGQLHDEALRWGSVNSASVVGKVGPQAGLLSVGQIRSRLKKNPSFRATIM
jgi:sugar/nucleoside kinase (ribokinase family)